MKRLHIIGILILVSGPAYPGEPDRQVPGNLLTTFEHIASPNFGILNDIIRDDRGFLWFGTTRGLCKYDGYRVRVFLHPSPFVSDVLAMTKLNSDALLLATGKGLWMFDLKAEQFSPFLPHMNFSESEVSGIVKDAHGTFWIGTSSLGLFGYDSTTHAVQAYTTADGMCSNGITALLLDHTGRLWIGTSAGLSAFDIRKRRFSNYRNKAGEKEPPLSDRITALCERDQKELWIGTNEGISVLDNESGALRPVDLPSPTKHTIWSMRSDPWGKMWVAVSELGLFSYSNGEFTRFEPSSPAGRSMNTIRVLYPDPVASSRTSVLLWVGTRNGVNKILISKNPFTNHVGDQEPLQLNRGAIISLYEGRDNVLWLGLWGGGLNGLRRENGAYRRVFNFVRTSDGPISLPDNDVNSLAEDQQGDLWIGTNQGLARLDAERKRVRTYKHDGGDSSSLAGNEVTAVFVDGSNTVWVCTTAGLSRLVRGTHDRFRNYLDNPADSPPLGGREVSDVREDHLSNLWVSTYGRGLNRLEANGTFTRFLQTSDTAGNRENFIYSFAEDRRGMFWLSTGAGLVSFDPHSGTFKPYVIGQLYGAVILGIQPDGEGNLWLSSGIGLARYHLGSNTFVRYDDKHGMPFSELFSRFIRTKDGRFIVAGIDGFSEFSPNDFSTAIPPPEIAITAFTVFDKEVSGWSGAAGEIHLSHDQNFFSFSFAALDYADPDENRFTYRMAGIDEHWIEAGTRNYASYTNLNPGRYVFYLKGCNSQNVWNETGTSITISIAPPFWQTWWFRLLAAGLISGIVYSAYRYRLARLLEMERLRLRIADDLHDDVGSNLSAIAMVSRDAQRAPELTTATKEKLAEIYDTAMATTEGMKDIVWFIKPRGDTLDELLMRMKESASSLLGEIRYTIQTPDHDRTLRISIDLKKHFFLAFKEILTNAARHSGASEVRIQVSRSDSELEMVIRDDGRGFDEQTRLQGNGLESLRSRAAHLGGVCEITAVPGKGTEVRFSGKL